MVWIENIAKYLNDLLGQKLEITFISKKKMNGLPLYLTKSYTPYELVLFGKQIVILRQATEANESPRRIANDLVRLRKHFNRDVAIVLDQLASWKRKRLIEKQFPFIVPGRQLYLPMLLLDLREHFPPTPSIAKESLSRAAQHTVLRQILYGDVENRSMTFIANLLGYSAMMMTKIRKELVAFGFCTVEHHGRSRHMIFPMSAKQLWTKAQIKMRSPVFKTHFLSGEISNVYLAGLSALAQQSLLSQVELQTFAVWKKQFRKKIKDNGLVEIESEDGADFVLEEWYYDPQKLSDSKIVDPLSLYLSLRDHPDERIQIAFEDIWEILPWSKE